MDIAQYYFSKIDAPHKESDLTIKCNDTQFYVHTFALNTRERFSGHKNFKECTDGVIDLSKHSSVLVREVMRSIYLGFVDGLALKMAGIEFSEISTELKYFSVDDGLIQNAIRQITQLLSRKERFDQLVKVATEGSSSVLSILKESVDSSYLLETAKKLSFEALDQLLLAYNSYAVVEAPKKGLRNLNSIHRPSCLCLKFKPNSLLCPKITPLTADFDGIIRSLDKDVIQSYRNICYIVLALDGPHVTLVGYQNQSFNYTTADDLAEVLVSGKFDNSKEFSERRRCSTPIISYTEDPIHGALLCAKTLGRRIDNPKPVAILRSSNSFDLSVNFQMPLLLC